MNCIAARGAAAFVENISTTLNDRDAAQHDDHRDREQQGRPKVLALLHRRGIHIDEHASKALSICFVTAVLVCGMDVRFQRRRR